MGAVQKFYCDVCGAEVSTKAFKLTIDDVPSMAHVVESDLCGTCYSTLLDFFKARKAEKTTLWTPKEPEPVPVGELGV